MSVLPVRLPLYPIANASDAVQRLLEKDAKAADALSSDASDKAGRTGAEVAASDAGNQLQRITAVEGSIGVVTSPPVRSGAAQFVSVAPTEIAAQNDNRPVDTAEVRSAAEGYVGQSEATRSDTPNTIADLGADRDAISTLLDTSALIAATATQPFNTKAEPTAVYM